MMNARAGEVLDYWRSIGPNGWWRKSAEQDAEIEERFTGALDEALAGELDDWTETPEGSLALVLLCDQMCRNMNRGSGAMYRGDGKALRIAAAAIERGQDEAIDLELRGFLYMPFMHAESGELQRRSLELFERLVAAGGPDYRRYAEDHRRIVERFGRFPHRNELLGRESSDEERAFLAEPGSSF